MDVKIVLTKISASTVNLVFIWLIKAVSVNIILLILECD